MFSCSGWVFLIFEGCGLSHFGFAQCRLWQRHLPAISPETICQASPVRLSFRGNLGAGRARLVQSWWLSIPLAALEIGLIFVAKFWGKRLYLQNICYNANYLFKFGENDEQQSDYF